ncbi:MAG: DUF1905 domain-containing protein [Hyphomicrobiales bacterium]
MEDLNFTFTSELWQYSGKGGWFFVTVPKGDSEQIKFFAHSAKVGFGSVRVTAKIADVAWKTSLFPDAKSGCYFLPVNAKIRKQAKLTKGQDIKVNIDIVT